ncbi:thioredoxin [Syncephalastrum racemosum]|uniref:Thioredoxin n=1 Tax=Syncephalastrum racemosum TaxID=13706 RepID=A0A1X2H937_SYNRA|nr:thioredoxin [Syncephalastrum racemosum]
MNHPKNLDQFKELIAKNKLVVIDFSAEWCGPCKVVGPKFAKLPESYPDIAFAKVDVDEAPDVAEFCSIRAMPTFQIFKDGKHVDEIVGATLPLVETKIKQHALA